VRGESPFPSRRPFSSAFEYAALISIGWSLDRILAPNNGQIFLVAICSYRSCVRGEAKADELFLNLTQRFADQGRNISDKQNSPNYAPNALAEDTDAKKHGIRRADFKAAMSRLFSAGKIHLVSYGRPSRPYVKLAVVEAG
jgi:hypothetical protein